MQDRVSQLASAEVLLNAAMDLIVDAAGEMDAIDDKEMGLPIHQLANRTQDVLDGLLRKRLELETSG